MDAGGGGGGGEGGVGGSARPQGTTLAAALPTFPKLQRTAAGRLSAAAAVRRYDGALARILLRINVFAQNFIRYKQLVTSFMRDDIQAQIILNTTDRLGILRINIFSQKNQQVSFPTK